MNVDPTPFQTTMIEERADPTGRKKPIVSDSFLAYLNGMRAASNAAFAGVGNGNVGPAFRNLLIDGGFEIWDGNRNFTPIPAQQYTGCTMWSYGQNGAGAVTYSRQPGIAPGSQYCMRVQRGLGSAFVAAVQIYQDMETVNTLPIAGQTLTLSFWARCGADYSNVGKSFNAVIAYGFGVDQALRIAYTGRVVIVKPFILSTVAQQFVMSGAIPANATQVGIIMGYTPTGVAGANDWFEIDNVQLETGTYATNFEVLPWATQKIRTEGYYWKTFEYDTAPASATPGTGATINYNAIFAGVAQPWRGNIVYNTRLRNVLNTSVTVTTYNPSAANANWRNTTLGADSGVPVTASFQRQLVIINPQVAGDAVGNRMDIHATVDARL